MKRTKNQVIREASFAAQALYAANQAKPKARSFCRLLSRRATASGKITNAFATARPTLFYLISPEAARMTVLGQNQHLVIVNNEKKREGLSGRAAGSLGCVVAAIGLT
jgi:hypothetical protein